jgi:hypothetical protein
MEHQGGNQIVKSRQEKSCLRDLLKITDIFFIILTYLPPTSLNNALTCCKLAFQHFHTPEVMNNIWREWRVQYPRGKNTRSFKTLWERIQKFEANNVQSKLTKEQMRPISDLFEECELLKMRVNYQSDLIHGLLEQIDNLEDNYNDLEYNYFDRSYLREMSDSEVWFELWQQTSKKHGLRKGFEKILDECDDVTRVEGTKGYTYLRSPK